MERFYRGKNGYTSLHFVIIIILLLAATIRIIRIRIKVCSHNFIVLFSHFFNNFLNIFIILVNIKLFCLCAYRFADFPLNINLRYLWYFFCSQYFSTILPIDFSVSGLFASGSMIYVIMHSEDRFSLYSAV